MARKPSMRVSQTLWSPYLSHAASTQAGEHWYPTASTAETRWSACTWLCVPPNLWD